MSDPRPDPSRPSMAVDIACVGFGPAAGGFLTALSRTLEARAGDPAFASRAAPGLPLQVVCYERSEDIGFGVSGVATRGRALRESFPDLDSAAIPMAHPIVSERLVYLMDPAGASRRGTALRAVDALLRSAGDLVGLPDYAVELPWVPPFLRKRGGLVLSIGQLSQWVGTRLMGSGQVQIWPATPVAGPLVDGAAVRGIRLADQGSDAAGGSMPGMDILAGLTVVADGPVGPVGRELDERLGTPERCERRDWAVGMKMVVELPGHGRWEPGTVIHTFGYPEPGIFGFLYVHDERTASLGIFVPSWLDSPARTAYRYLQHWMLHPYIWPGLEGGAMRSWGAKSLLESGRRGEPHLAGDGFARIGEGSGTTNILTGSGVDEAWESGALLAEGVAEILEKGLPFSKESLEAAWVRRRRASRLERETRIAERSRDGFQRGVLTGLLGMALTGLTGGRINLRATPSRLRARERSLEECYRGRIPPAEIRSLRETCAARGLPLHDALMDRSGWPAIPCDGRLLVSHQDALLLGGKVQAPPGADHVVIADPCLCAECDPQPCVEICSGQALAPGEAGAAPRFDRDKCVHCGACTWSCAHRLPGRPATGNIELRAGSGGLHSAEN